MRLNIKDLPPRYQEQIARDIAKETRHRTTISDADLESDTGHEPLAEGQDAYFTSRVDIHLHSVRKRLADPDGISGKAVIDQCVRSGLLHDDGQAQVRQVTFSQEKGTPEKTIVTIEEVGNNRRELRLKET